MAKKRMKEFGHHGLVLTDDDELLRSFIFITWQESMPDTWVDFIRSTGLKWFVSPLHDKDWNDELKAYKKPHYHHVIVSDGQLYVGQVVSLIKALGCDMRPEKPLNLAGCIQYLVHYNDKDKAQYDVDKIMCFNGADISSYFYGSKSEVRSDIASLVEFCERLGIIEFADAVNECCTGGVDIRYLDLLIKNPSFWNSYFRSRAMMGVGSDGKRYDNLSYVNCRRQIGRYFGQ